jgi:hypothetical protein
LTRIFNDPCCGLFGNIGEDNNPCQVYSNNIIRFVVTAFSNDVRTQAFDQLVWGVLVEDHHLVNAGQRPQNLGPILLGIDRTIRALDPPDGCVRVQADHEPRAERLGRLQITDVADVQDVEAAVGED